jgi:hypothetical protein
MEKSQGGRPRGALSVQPHLVMRRHVHLTIHKQRTPLFAAWLAQHNQADGRRLAGDLVELLEKALAGRNVVLEAPVGEQVFEVDMSGLMEWD